MYNVTLQINLSPGDINYAHLTVPPLVKSHRENVDEVLAIVDCCRPQKTKIIDPEKRFPEPSFSERVEKISIITENLKSKGYIDTIVYLHPNNSIQPILAHKYLGDWVNETHDYGGCALMSYLAAFEVTKTRYLIHYDADMLLYQAPNYDWSIEARNLIDKEEKAVAATPRISPPFSKEKKLVDAPSLHEGRPLYKVESGWRNDWFSTRCFLIDITKLSSYLPLIQGHLLLETLAIKYLNRGYPRSPEIMLHKRIGSAGGWQLNMDTERAWLLHPATKPTRYLELLPRIQEAILAGQVPNEQEGYADINLSAWERFLNLANTNNTKNS
ncbi:hypothetical protein [Calothrix sp. NIES-3974]|uniref:hypothetical protein n=1 Tax=Calothrix sp. NIES-3974 TaxID=2005462 RepID=UPI000B617695|nr:hypothetical protein [Calothrix sp. NIES-3974]BAZ03601.1 hypothetical protein NIES3974_02300 [Calothrix sp. NIES-3974]